MALKDTPHRARASAICYSLIETAKVNNLKPYAYVKYVLDRIGDANTPKKLEVLLPWNVSMHKFEKTMQIFGGINRSM